MFLFADLKEPLGSVGDGPKVGARTETVHGHFCLFSVAPCQPVLALAVLVAFSLGLWGLDEALFRLRRTA